RQQVRKGCGPYRIYGPGPALLCERPCGPRKLLAVDDLLSPEPLQVIGFPGASGYRMNGKAALGEDCDRDGPDAAPPTPHPDRTPYRAEPMALHRHPS